MSATLTNPAKVPTEEHDILFQDWFKSTGPRTYAVQVKKASNGNHYLVLTEGKRDKETDEVRKTRLFLFSEDFKAFFDMLHKTAVFIRENPVPPEVKKRQGQFWSKANRNRKNAGPRHESPPEKQKLPLSTPPH